MAQSYDTLIIGGGLAGLVAANRLAQSGLRPLVLEASQSAGGRARTREVEGLRFNLGPHALYRAGAARRVLRSLNIPIDGAPAPVDGALAWSGGRHHTLPVGFVSLLSSGLLPVGAKLEFAKLMSRLDGFDAKEWAGQTVSQWLQAQRLRPATRALVEALVRLATYAHAPDILDASAAIRQLQQSGAGVLYLHGGWVRLVDALIDALQRSGGGIRTRARARRVVGRDRFEGIELADGTVLHARSAILAVAPSVAAGLIDAAPAAAWTSGLMVRAACLDVGLMALDRPRRRFQLGIDTPEYVSVHSTVAELGEGQVVHAARYLGPEDAPPKQDALEAVVERLQPGFRRQAVHMAYHPQMIVSHGHPRADQGGRRPDPQVSELAGLYIAGDWVGDEGLLADAACASADRAASLVIEAQTEARAA